MTVKQIEREIFELTTLSSGTVRLSVHSWLFTNASRRDRKKKPHTCQSNVMNTWCLQVRREFSTLTRKNVLIQLSELVFWTWSTSRTRLVTSNSTTSRARVWRRNELHFNRHGNERANLFLLSGVMQESRGGGGGGGWRVSLQLTDDWQPAEGHGRLSRITGRVQTQRGTKTQTVKQ